METGQGPERDRLRSPRDYRLAALIFGTILGGAALLGYVAYRLEVGAARRELQRQTLAVGRLKAREISNWIGERRNDIAAAAMGSRMALDVERWRAERRRDPVELRWVRRRLEAFRTHGDYDEVAVVAPDGSLLLAARSDPPVLPHLDVALARRAVRQETVAFAPLRRAGDGEPTIFMDVIAPLTAVDDRGRRVVGGLVYRIDPRKYLFPLVKSWPTDSASAETLLAERDGDSVRFLNDLRHLEGTALTLRRPLSDPDLIAAKGARGERGVVEGVDYRGVPVLAAVEAVEGTSWIMVTKIDQTEAYAPLRDYVWIYLAFLALAATTATQAARTWIRGVREASLQREHDATRAYVAALEHAEAEREALIASLTKAFADVKTLRGIVPICASCKRIRDDAGFWEQVESYVSEHTEAEFSHGVCPECAARLYPGYLETPPPGKR